MRAITNSAATGLTTALRRVATMPTSPAHPTSSDTSSAAVRAGGRTSMRRPGPGGNVRYPAPPVRLTRRGRIVVVSAIAAAALGMLWLGTHAAVTASARPPVPSVSGLPWVTVQRGDTLWDIAGAATATGADPAPVVLEIMRLNALTDSVIQPGRRLYLPSAH